MKKIIKNKMVLVLALILSLASCDDFLDVEDLDSLDITNLYQTEDDLKLALNALYFALPVSDLQEPVFSLDPSQAYFLPYFWTDDAIHRNINGVGPNGSDFFWGDGTPPIRTFYRYQDIQDINVFLQALPDANFNTESNRERFAAEARFIRAWIYETMVFAYGDVPLVTTTLPSTAKPSRTPRQEVFDFVINELTEIEDQLPNTYSSEDGGRITKGAVLALQSRAYLNAIGWHSNVDDMYKQAEIASKKIIDSNIYSLANGIDGFAEQFTIESDLVSPETILASVYVPEFRTNPIARQIGLRGTFRGFSGGGVNQRRPGYTSDFIEEVQTINGLFPKDDPSYNPADPWTNRDPRLRVSAVLPGDILPANGTGDLTYEFQPHPNINPSGTGDNLGGVNTPTGYSFKKYLDYDLDVVEQGNVDLKIIRYSEVLLMYAEALAGQGKDSDAIIYLDMVRNRVGMPLYTNIGLPTVTRGTTGNQMIDAILLERRYEFAGEGPQRWFDIWRYKLGDQVITQVYGIPLSETEPGDLNGPKYTGGNDTTFSRVWSDHYYLLPIYSVYRNSNSSLTQNPDY